MSIRLKLIQLGLVFSFLIIVSAAVPPSFSKPIYLPSSSSQPKPARKNILLLFPYQPNLPHHILATQAIEQELLQASDFEFDLYFEYLDLNRFPASTYMRQAFSLLAAKYRHKPIDLVIIANEITLDLWLENRSQIAPDAPVVFFNIPAGRLNALNLLANFTGTGTRVEYSPALEWLLTVRPEINEIVLVRGVGKADKEGIQSVDNLLEVFAGRLKITDLSNLSLEEIKIRVASLPPTSVVVFHMLFEDVTGVQYIPLEALREVAAAASVPVLSGYAQFIGTGTLGGYMYSVTEEASQAARTGLRILRGESASAIPVITGPGNRFIFDQAVLRRFNIPEASLPPNSLVENKDINLWEYHRTEIVATGVMILALTILSLYLGTISRQLNITRDALTRLNADLETQVEERTAKLSESNLRLELEIAERRQAEDLMRNSEEKYRFLAENITDVIWIFDMNQQMFTYVSPSIERQLGYSAAEVQSRRMDEILTPKSAEKAAIGIGQTFQLYLDDPSDPQIDYDDLEMLHKNGSTVWTETITNYHTNEKTGHIEIIGVSRDISARKIAQDSLRQLSRAVDQSASMILITNTQGAIEFVNPAFEKGTGYSLAEVRGKNPRLLKSGQVPGEVFQNLWETISRGDIWQGELLNRKKNGELFWENAIISPIRDPDGQISHYVAVNEDITIRKKHEAELHDYTKKLEVLQAQLREQAIRDPLTGVFNRRYLMETLDREIARSRRENHPLSLMIMDVDYFKIVNDTYGHLVGDQTLQRLARLLEKSTRKGDVICRYGGEEFVVLMPHTSLEDAVRRAESWRNTLENSPLQFSGLTIAVTISVGVASNEAEDMTSQDLLSQADRSLYRAKGNGRNRVVAQDTLLRS